MISPCQPNVSLALRLLTLDRHCRPAAAAVGTRPMKARKVLRLAGRARAWPTAGGPAGRPGVARGAGGRPGAARGIGGAGCTGAYA